MIPQPRFCTQCAGPLARQRVDGRQLYRCIRCDAVAYLDPKLVAAALVERHGAILMVQRNIEPGMGLWSLPGGYVDRGEAVEAAVRREVREETGLEVVVGRLVGLYSEAGSPVVLAAYAAAPQGGEPRAASAEVQDVGFFSLGALPPLAFPRDERVIGDYLQGNPS